MRTLLLTLLLLPVVARAQVIVNTAGYLYEYYSGDGGPATAARMINPYGLTISKTGNLYIADYANYVIRKVDTAGIITTVAGVHAHGYSGDNGPATAAQIAFPWDVAVDSMENMYIADMDNQVIRKVDASGIITTFAGNHTYSYAGDGGMATNAAMYNPECVAIDHHGNVYIGDGGNSRIRMVNTSGIITTIAGNGTNGYSGDGGPATAAQLSHAAYMTFDVAGNMYFSDFANNVIRKIDTAGIITTVAGTGVSGYSGNGGPATLARLNQPTGIAVDRNGTIYVSDFGNVLIRKIDASNIISNVCGIPMIAGYSGNYVVAAGAEISGPSGLSVDTSGTLYFSNCFNNMVQRIIMHCMGTPVNGQDSICIGSAVLMTDSFPGGTWGVTNGRASITADGMVTGISTGLDTVTYTTNNNCGTQTVMKIVHIESPAGLVTGTDSVCLGSAAQFYNNVPWGVWSVAGAGAVIAPSGQLTANTTGADTVKYTLVNSCGTSVGAHVVYVVPPVPPTPITGPDSICAYYTYHYTDSVAGGLWSNNTALGSIVGGYLTGMNPGVDTVVYIINYIAPVTCAVRCTKGVRIDVAINAGTIQGIDSVCPGDSIVLMATVPGGAWSVQNSRAAISATGTVTGITPGTDMITYTVANACGTVTTQKLIKVRTAASCALSVADESSDDVVVLIYPDPATSMLTVSAGNAINQIRIADLTGRTVYNEQYNAVKIDIDLTNLASGMYFMKINEGIVRKFVKQ